MIVVDDAPIMLPMKFENNKYQAITEIPAPRPYIGGKGYLINEYANTCGAKV